MLPVRVIGGPGKEVPPERARTTQRKKELSAPGGTGLRNINGPESLSSRCLQFRATDAAASDLG
jgi:hypothetical protein